MASAHVRAYASKLSAHKSCTEDILQISDMAEDIYLTSQVADTLSV